MRRILLMAASTVAVLANAITPAYAKGPSTAQLEVLAGMPGYYTLATPDQVRAHTKGVTLGASSVKRIEDKEDMITPLMRAASETPYPEVIDILVEAGSDINAVSMPESAKAWPPRITAVYYAVENPDPAILAALLAHKPDLNLLADSDNAPSALVLAANTRDRDRHFSLLLEAGARPSRKEIRDGSIWNFLGLGKTRVEAYRQIPGPRTDPAIAAAQTKALLAVIPAPECKTFRSALQAGQSEAALLLIQAGVDPGCGEKDRPNNLSYALGRSDREHAIPDPSLELLSILLNYNDVNYGAPEPGALENDKHGSVFDHSAFALACQGAMDVALARMIREAGATINTAYNGPMVEALKAWRDNPDLVAYLLELGFSPTRPDRSGTRPMDAAQNRPYKLQSAPLLIRAGAEPPAWRIRGEDFNEEFLVRSGIYGPEGRLLIQPGRNVRDDAFYAAKAKEILAEARAHPEVALYSDAFYRVATPEDVKEVIGGRSLHRVRTRSGSYRLRSGHGPAAGISTVYAYLTGNLVQTWRVQDTPLIHAADVTPYPEVIDVLAAAGSDVRAVKSEALANAVRNPNPKVLERVLAHKPDLDAPMYDRATPLHYLAWAREATNEHLRLFLAAKPDLNVLDDDGRTPLMRAIRFKREDRARTLIRAGADINAGTENGPTALKTAVESGMYGLARDLIKAGAEDRPTRQGYSALSVAAERESCDPQLIRDLLALAGLQSARAAEALKQAIMEGNVVGYTQLIQGGVPTNKENMAWALGMLINSTKNEAKALPMVERLLADGVDPNGKDRHGRSFLHCCVDRLMPDTCKTLIKAGANVNERLFEGNTLLLRAVDVDGDYMEGNPLAARRAGVVRALIAGDADVRAENEEGWNAMLLGMNKPDVLEQLLAAGFPVNERARCGWTPLGYAASHHNYTKAIPALMAAGADPDLAVKRFGKIPEQIARQKKNGEALALLEQGRKAK